MPTMPRLLRKGLFWILVALSTSGLALAQGAASQKTAAGAAYGDAIHDAALKGDLEQAKALLKAQPALASSKDDKGMTPLDVTAAAGHVDMAELLIANHADVNDEGCPMCMASMFGQTEMVAFLLSKGADIEKGAPLVLAALIGRKEVVSLLLDKGAKINAKSGDGTTALHAAAQQGNESVVEVLLARQADITTRDRHGATPLLVAAFNDKKDVVAKLLASHADANARDEKGRTALIYAASAGKQELAALLLDNKADVNLGFNGGFTPLHLAAGNGNKEMVSLLLAHGADINAADETMGETPAQWAKRMGKTEMADFLLSYAEAHPAKIAPGTASSASLTGANGEKPRALTTADGLSCAFSQDISASLNGGLSGTMSARANHFRCKDKTGKDVEIDLISSDPSVNAGLEDGKVAIRTKMFGTVYRGNQPGTFGTYELTESQIKKLKAFLGL